MSLQDVVHKLVDVAAGLDRIGAHEAPALHEAIDAGKVVAEDVAKDAPVVAQVVTDVAAGL